MIKNRDQEGVGVGGWVHIHTTNQTNGMQDIRRRRTERGNRNIFKYYTTWMLNTLQRWAFVGGEIDNRFYRECVVTSCAKDFT